MSKVGYPVDRIHTFSGDAADAAKDDLDAHDAQWYQVLEAIQEFPSFMQGTLTDALSAYSNRLKDSYTWQMTVAAELYVKAKDMEYYDGGQSVMFQFWHPDLFK